MKKVTIKDVAKRAKVSTASITNALNPTSTKISDEKRAEILKVINEMGYVPMKSAQNLSSKKQRKVGFFMRNSEEMSTNIVNGQLIYYMNKIAHDYSIDLVNIITSIDNEENYEEIKSKIQGYNFTDLIIHGLDREATTLKKISELNIRKLLIEIPYNNETTNFITTDNYHAQVDLIEEINSKKNLKHVLYIPGEKNAYVSEERLNGMKTAARKIGFSLDITDGTFSPGEVEKIISKINLQKYDLIAAGSDSVIISVCEYININEINDAGIIYAGFDGNLIINHINRPIFTIKQNIELLVENIFDMLKTNNYKNQMIPYEIDSNLYAKRKQY